MISNHARMLLLVLVLVNGLHASDPDDNTPDNLLTDALVAETTQESSVASEASMVEATSVRLIPPDWLEAKPLKEIPLGNSGWLDIGGSYRARHHRENNIRPGTTGGLSGLDDTFWLHQTRLWFDGQWNSQIGFRVGVIDAASAGEVFPSRNREVNRLDLYQAHVNMVLHEDVGKLTA